MKGSLVSALAATALLASASAMAQAPSSADAAMMAETCAGCHGTDGTSAGPASPSIAGIDKEYFVLAMKDYAAGTRPSTVMTRIAKGYSEADFKAMAEYFAVRTMGPAKQAFDPELAAKGKDLQARFCENCHEKGGTAGDGMAKVAGQWMPYLQFSLTDFSNGSREMERRKRQRMTELATEAGDDGYNAILHYLASQQ